MLCCKYKVIAGALGPGETDHMFVRGSHRIPKRGSPYCSVAHSSPRFPLLSCHGLRATVELAAHRKSNRQTFALVSAGGLPGAGGDASG